MKKKMKIRYRSNSNSVKITFDDGVENIVITEKEVGVLHVVNNSSFSIDEKMGEALYILFFDRKLEHEREIYEKEHGKTTYEEGEE